MSESEERIRDLLQKSRADSFSPFFPERVMRRVRELDSPRAAHGDSLYDAMRWVFVRISVAAVVLIIALGLLNILQYGTADGVDLVDALLGLPSDALADMLTYDLI
jgi:hypothetical protein